MGADALAPFRRHPLPPPMNGPTTPIAEVAGKLMADQELALVAAAECKGGAFWTPYPVGDVSLARSGTLTELGLAVRNHLLAQSAPVTPISNERGDEM